MTNNNVQANSPKPEPYLTINTDLCPIWDARNNLHRLHGCISAITYLSHPLIKDGELKDVYTLLITIEEEVDKAYNMLNDAIEGSEQIRATA